MQSVGTVIVDVPASRTVRNKTVCCSEASMSIWYLLEEPEQTETILLTMLGFYRFSRF